MGEWKHSFGAAAHFLIPLRFALAEPKSDS
jgi:hypothetical protein